MIYARTIRTLAGPVKLTIEQNGSVFCYRYSVKTAGPDGALYRQVDVDEGALRYSEPPGEYLRWIEEHALADLGRELTREIQ